MRIAAIGDLHCSADSAGTIRRLLDDIEREAELLLIAGDLTDNGLLGEIQVLEDELATVSIPIIAVLGNHDYENDQAEALVEALSRIDVTVLNGTVREVDGVGFVGVKGFAGGFGERLVQPFGERALKTFIEACIEEAVRLENAVSKLESERKIAILHYAPVKETLEGESPELYPFLGSSRLADALDRHHVDLVVHGHAHHGAPHGQTPGGIPVYNVSRFVQSQYESRAYRLFDV